MPFLVAGVSFLSRQYLEDKGAAALQTRLYQQRLVTTWLLRTALTYLQVPL